MDLTFSLAYLTLITDDFGNALHVRDFGNSAYCANIRYAYSDSTI